MRALILEDDPIIVQSLELILVSQSFALEVHYEIEEGIDLAKRYDFDIIIVGMDNLNIIREIRKAGVDTPIFALSNGVDVQTMIAAFENGADDFLLKPFNRDELLARIRAVIRRSRGHAKSFIAIGDIKIDIDSKTVFVFERPVRMTTKEYQILELLALRQGSTITKEMFMDHLYNEIDHEPQLKIIDVFICKLRQKLGAAADQLETIWGRGYILRSPSIVPSGEEKVA